MTDLSIIQEAKKFKKLLDESDISQMQIALDFNVSTAYVSYRLSLLTLPQPLQDRIETEDLSAHKATELARVYKHGVDETEFKALVELAFGSSLKQFKEKVLSLIDKPKRNRGSKSEPATPTSLSTPRPGMAKTAVAKLHNRPDIRDEEEIRDVVEAYTEADDDSESIFYTVNALRWVLNNKDARLPEADGVVDTDDTDDE